MSSKTLKKLFKFIVRVHRVATFPKSSAHGKVAQLHVLMLQPIKLSSQSFSVANSSTETVSYSKNVLVLSDGRV